MKETINIGLIGYGIVGSGAVKILIENEDAIARKVGSRLVVKRIADLDITTPRPFAVDPSVLTTDVSSLLDDHDIDIVIETIGGTKPAGDFIERALRSGKSVVTANKELIAKEGERFLPLAAQLGLDFMFEASVGGGIPIISPMKGSLAGNEILQVKGIVNGTTNYILTRMRMEGLGYEEIVKDAQARGYAEADPSADVDGHDAAYKTAILASIAFTTRVDVNRVYREGITNLNATDMRYADELGYVIKLLGIAQIIDGKVLARVHPTFVPKGHPLAHVDYVNNAILVQGSAVGEVMFYGPGAGSGAAGSAVVGDVIEVARNIRQGCCARVPCTCFDQRDMLGMDSVVCKNYIRILAQDKPRVLATIANEFADRNVSIESVLQKNLLDSDAEIVWLTHEAPEPMVRGALDAISKLSVVKQVSSWVRVAD